MIVALLNLYNRCYNLTQDRSLLCDLKQQSWRSRSHQNNQWCATCLSAIIA
ncbi:hypothetical protein I4641_06795 [Waterburya agarophytonicola K14]|uniref:Uncharacterized protein n=1 Tax=Waterburya agarophytonicola KI4 TaxID=2874699 RepID=A0A964BNU4_9CYAN|nr:hypothetical protein [Waterburya agarophytonicola]MCC0176685.1 hypothetical protein [Waterburya agarophytonicola KI4]